MILFVCVGNVCRSPLAAAIVRSGLEAAGVDVPVASAGTHALIGSPMDPLSVSILERYGIAPAAHAAVQLDRNLVQQSDLVLTATRQVRRSVVQLYAPAVKYVFTIRQFGRILADAEEPFAPTDDSSAALVADLRSFVVKHRGPSTLSEPGDDDVIDPHGRPRSVHATCANQMLSALQQLIVALGGYLVGESPPQARHGISYFV